MVACDDCFDGSCTVSESPSNGCKEKSKKSDDKPKDYAIIAMAERVTMLFMLLRKR